jgi:hypothetical protein
MEDPAIIAPNKCRVCGCTEERACLFPNDDGGMTACWWVDRAHTLCSNPDCIAGLSLDKLLLIADFDGVGR